MAMRIDVARRRKEIADEIAAAPVVQRRDIVEEVAQKYGVCIGTVRTACKEHRVRIKRLRQVN